MLASQAEDAGSIHAIRLNKKAMALIAVAFFVYQIINLRPLYLFFHIMFKYTINIYQFYFIYL